MSNFLHLRFHVALSLFCLFGRFLFFLLSPVYFSRYSFVASALSFRSTILPLMSLLVYLFGWYVLPISLMPAKRSLVFFELLTRSFIHSTLSSSLCCFIFFCILFHFLCSVIGFICDLSLASLLVSSDRLSFLADGCFLGCDSIIFC